jgi:hypothetical protein
VDWPPLRFGQPLTPSLGGSCLHTVQKECATANMNERNNNPRLIEPARLEALGNAVPFGEYRLYSGSTQLPSGVPWGGSDCRFVVVAASSYSGESISGLNPSMTPSGSIYLWRAYRIGPSGSPPYKVDDCLYYSGPEGETWSMHSKDAPDHHTAIMSASGMDSIAHVFGLPPASAGKIGEFRDAGAYLDFEQPFWKPRDS